MKIKRTDIWAIGVMGLGAAITAKVYDLLPTRMATHFDLAGNPNGWMSREWGAWFLPAFILVLWALIRFGNRVLPQSEKKRLGEPAVAFVATLTATFLVAVHMMILRFAIVPGAEIHRPLWLAMGALWIALGLVFPRIKRNALVGIRTPWTLTSDEVWARTQRLAGYAMVIGGVAGALAGVVLPIGLSGALALVLFLGSAVVPAVYSLVLARRADPS